jgi:hypothetical protein
MANALRLNGKWVEVESLAQASEMVRRDIDATGVGATEWYDYNLPTAKQGEVREAGKSIGHISYNGRIWPVKAA